MIALPLSLSLSSSFTEVGAIAAFAALLGIAILSLLAFSQAREIKRLREWAGRAPERAAEIEQRVSTEAAARLQRQGAPVATRVVPRKTPLVSAPVSNAVNATAAAAAVAGTQAPASPAVSPDQPGVSGAPSSDVQQQGGEDGALTGSSTTETSRVESKPAEGTAGPAVETPGEDGVKGTPESSQPKQEIGTEPAQAPAGPMGQEAARKDERADTDGQDRSAAEPIVAAPATAAARAVGITPRSPLPPSPAKPAPPGASVSSPAQASGRAPALESSAAPLESPAPSSRPPAPVAASRRMPSRAVAAGGIDASARSPLPQRSRSATAMGGAAARGPGAPASGSGPKYFKPERSSGRGVALIVGGVIVAVLLLIFAVSALKGSGKGAATATQSSSAVETQAPTTQTTTSTSKTVVSNPAETAVAVLNGTSTAGLAHHLAADLQQGGYTRAVALAGVPPGTHATTVVQYAHGHRADAQAVAKSLNVAQVQAMETTIASLVGSATVVVVAGADQASEIGGGGAQSNGEPAVGAGSG